MDTKEVTKETLTPQEELFCTAFGDVESETYGNATASAAKAKYSSPGNSGWKVKQRPRIKKRLAELYKANASDIGRVMSDLRSVQLRAEAKGDLATATACLKLQGQRYGLFTERVVTIDDEEQRKLTEKEEAEAHRLATIRLTQPPEPDNTKASCKTCGQ